MISHTTGRSLGCHATKEKAEAQLRAIEISKHKESIVNDSAIEESNRLNRMSNALRMLHLGGE